jgi:hypothetical protein
MSGFGNIRLAESYLNAQLASAGPPGPELSAGPFLTISREAGTGGSAVAEALMSRLTDEGSRAHGSRAHGDMS